MATTRREFVKIAAAAGAGAGLCGTAAFGADTKAGRNADAARPDAAAKGKAGGAPQRTLLMLGGTGFLGPEIVEEALRRGFKVTLFNRGKTHPNLFPDLEKLQGDRRGNLKALEGRRWDAVVDTSGYFPVDVRDSAQLLKNSGQYVFVSSISVYADNSKPGMDESAATLKLPDGTDPYSIKDRADIMKYYGELKALCELEAERAFPGKALIVRPGLIVGPTDPTDRFTYWPVRVAKGGEVLAPGTPDDPVQIVDVRDLGAFIAALVDRNVNGTFHATGPKEKLSIGAMLEACRKASGSSATFTWVPADFLEAQKVSAWQDMPVWVPPVGDMAGFSSVDCRRAIAAGLTFRPVVDTCRDTLAWWNEEPGERKAKLRAGIAAEREQEVLAAWRAKSAAPEGGATEPATPTAPAAPAAG